MAGYARPNGARKEKPAVRSGLGSGMRDQVFSDIALSATGSMSPDRQFQRNSVGYRDQNALPLPTK
jgi:hypothetical protein